MTLRRTWPAIAALIVISLIGAGTYLSGLWIPNWPSEKRYPIRGVDVSRHQGRIDWKIVSASGIHFAYIKATEGADFRDRNFERNWTESAATGLKRGAYHFFTLGTPGKLQAANFIATVPQDPDALPPAVDLERSGYNTTRRQSPAEFAKQLSVFIDALAAHYKQPPVIYTTYAFKREYLEKMLIDQLWIREILTKPHLGNGTWTFWQFSARGKVHGINAFVDLNVFNGSAKAFRELVKDRR